MFGFGFEFTPPITTLGDTQWALPELLSFKVFQGGASEKDLLLDVLSQGGLPQGGLPQGGLPQGGFAFIGWSRYILIWQRSCLTYGAGILFGSLFLISRLRARHTGE